MPLPIRTNKNGKCCMGEKTEKFTQVCKPLFYKAIKLVTCRGSNPIINSMNVDQKGLSQRIVVKKKQKWPMMRAKGSQTIDKVAEDKMTQFPDVAREVKEKEYFEYEFIKPSGSKEMVYKTVVSDIKYNYLNDVEGIKTQQSVNKRTVNADSSKVFTENTHYVEDTVDGRTYKQTESVTQFKGVGKETRRRQIELVSSTQPRHSQSRRVSRLTSQSRSANNPRGSTKLVYSLRPPSAGIQETAKTLNSVENDQRSGGGKVESYYDKRQKNTGRRPSNRKSQESSEQEMVEGLKQMKPNKSKQQLQTSGVSTSLIVSNHGPIPLTVKNSNSELSIIEDEKLTEAVTTFPDRSYSKPMSKRNSKLSDELKSASEKLSLAPKSQVSSKDEPVINDKAENPSPKGQSYATSNEDLTVDEANDPQKLFHVVESVASLTASVTKSSPDEQESAMRQNAVDTKNIIGKSHEFLQSNFNFKKIEESKELVDNSGKTKIKTHVYKETGEEKSDADGNLINMISIQSMSDTEIVNHETEADPFPIEDAEMEESEEEERDYPDNNCFRPQCANACGYCRSAYWRMRNMRGCNNCMNYSGMPKCNGQRCSYNCCYLRQC